ncbi:MAG: SDR family NAD(P)-dependent oxidoreductase [Myxococcales bacterium]|nr:SDR family NAD(P)-dependent oxidoreductase [Myxococcales bacterium]
MPEISLGGKVAVITGASRGIGLATGRALQAQGVTVIGTSRLPAYYSGHPFPLLTLDVADPASVDAFASQLVAMLDGRSIDILINNAGRLVVGTAIPIAPQLAPLFESQAQLAMETLHVGHVRVTNRLLPLMSQSDYSRLLFTASVAGTLTGGSDLSEANGISFLSTYNSGKRALLAYANSLGMFLKVSGSPIQVSTVNPMFIRTTLADRLNPIFLEPVDTEGNSQNPYLQAFLDAMRAITAAALPASFVAETYAQLLQMNAPLPNVVTGSTLEPYASQCGSALIESVWLAENAQAPAPLGPAGAGPLE